MLGLTTSPYLTTRRPSPTTIQYTVSTLPPLTLPLRLLYYLTHILRLLLGLSILLLLYTAYLSSSHGEPLTPFLETPLVFTNEFIWHVLYNLVSSSFGELLSSVAQSTPLVILLPASLTTLYILTLRPHTTESLLILRGLGIQTSTSSTTYLSGPTTRFIPTEKIQDILVNEAFRGFEVRYYLVVVVEGEESVVVVFPQLLPRRKVVEEVWRGSGGVLFERGEGKASRDRGKEKEGLI